LAGQLLSLHNSYIIEMNFWPTHGRAFCSTDYTGKEHDKNYRGCLYLDRGLSIHTLGAMPVPRFEIYVTGYKLAFLTIDS